MLLNVSIHPNNFNDNILSYDENITIYISRISNHFPTFFNNLVKSKGIMRKRIPSKESSSEESFA